VKHLMTVLAAAAFILAAGGAARAATVFWSLDDIDGSTGLADASVSTKGTLIEAGNFGGTGVPNVTVNSVLFTGVDFKGGGSPANLTGLTYDDGWSGYGTSTGGTIDALTDTFGAKSGVDPQNGMLTGLTPDKQYEVQFFLSHTTVSRTLDITSGGQTARIRTRTPAQFATGTFTADADTQAINFDASDGSQFLSAYQLREVPDLPAPTMTNIAVNGSSRTYTLAQGVMTNGAVAYTDRPYTWENVPAYLEGADYVMTPNDDRGDDTLLLDVTLAQPGTLYAWFDERVATPSWASAARGWADTGSDIIRLGPNRTETYDIYAKPLRAGTHTTALGPAGAPGKAMYGFAAVAGAGPAPRPLVTPTGALADLNRSGAGNPGPSVSGSVQWTIEPGLFPGGDVDLGENPGDDGSIAYWYLKPSSQGGGAYPPQSLYYDLGRAMTVDQIHLWWQDRDGPSNTGRVTDMDIDYLPLSAAQPGAFDLTTMQGLGGWANAVAAYDPSAGSFGVQQDLDPTDFLTRYLRLTMNASGYAGGNGDQWGGLRQVAVTEATVIPEPVTMTMTALALAGLGGYVRKRKRAMMRFMTILAAIGFVLAFSGAAQAELVAWYTFDEAGGSTATDSSGSANAHNATLNGLNPTFDPAAGKFGGAVWLPGINEHIQAADHGDFEFVANESFSISMWYKRDGIENDQGFITKGYADNPRKSNYYLLQTRSNGFTYDSRKTSSGSPRVQEDAGGNHGDDQWHHFVAVRDSAANRLRLYVDNVLKINYDMGTGDTNGDWAVGVHNEPLTIGDHLDRYTQGHFDDIGIWKGQALGAGEINTIYNSGIAALAGSSPSFPAPTLPGNLQVDIGRSDQPLLESGWQEWHFTGSSGTLNQTKPFLFADATDGTVDANVSTTTSGQGRNYGLDNVTDAGSLAIPDVWADQAFFNNNASGSMTLTLDDLKAGTYRFTSYHYADNLSDGGTNDEGTASAYIKVDTGSGFVDTGLDVTFISGILSNVSGGGQPSAADLDAFGTLTFEFTVANDGDTVSILFDDLAGGDTFGLNGFELEPVIAAIPEPITMTMTALALAGLGGYVRKRRRF